MFRTCLQSQEDIARYFFLGIFFLIQFSAPRIFPWKPCNQSGLNCYIQWWRDFWKLISHDKLDFFFFLRLEFLSYSWGQSLHLFYLELYCTLWLMRCYLKKKWATGIICLIFLSVQFTHSCPTLCDPVDCSTPGLPVHHQLPKLTHSHVHRVSDAIQPSLPLSSPSPPPSIFPSIKVFSNESVHHIR